MARKALEAFPISNPKLKFLAHSENISFRVDSDEGKSFVLRLHRPTYHKYEELVSEQLWTEALIEAGIDVPVGVRTSRGERYTRVESPDGHRYAGLLEWVDGKELGLPDTYAKFVGSGTDPYRALGRLIAELHDHAVAWSIPQGFTRHSFDVAGFVGNDPFWGRFWESQWLDQSQRNELLSIRELVEQILLEYGESSNNFSLIHADLHPHNVIANGPRLHIIDFDDSGFGWHAYDFAVALYGLKDSSDYQRSKTSLLEGYTDTRAIAHRDVDMIDFFLIVRSLASIGWVTARPELNRNSQSLCQHLYNDAVARLSRFDSN